MPYNIAKLNQARFFRDAGYLRLPTVLSPSFTAELKNFVADEHAAELAKQPNESVHKLYGLYDRRPELMRRLISHPVLLENLKTILGPHIVFIKNRHNHATVNDSSRKNTEGLHRDILQPTRGLLTAAVYLEDSTVDNGCTHIIPGSHRFDYVGVPQPDGGGTWLDEHEEYAGLAEQAIPVPMPSGGVLLFDGLAFHGVGRPQEHAEMTRTSITLGFRGIDELSAQPDRSREVLASGEYLYRGNDRPAT